MARIPQCAFCVEDRIAAHGRLDGFKDLDPPVTTVNGTKVCANHVERARKEKCVSEEEVMALIRKYLKAEEVA